MIIKNIKLENIRSYLNQEINFPLGRTLLSGDIGSGKSSILLAVDFALFGLQKDNLSGHSLLRNGKNSGYVELNFGIENKDVTIKRALKRIKNNIQQDFGYITINNEKNELTAVELKQAILNLLNYPQELLTKTKSLIYRYTVYTPQEEMKHVLLTDRESRLDILRKVFGIDKYKRIKENSKIYMGHLKENKKEIDIEISDLDEKINLRDEKQKELTKKEADINKFIDKLNTLKNNIKEYKNNIKAKEDDITKLKKINKDIELKDFELKNKSEQITINNNYLKELNSYIKELEEELKEDSVKNIEDIKKLIPIKENEIKFMEDTLKEVRNKLNGFKVNKENSERLKENLTKLDICPICKQNISKDYKHNMLHKENKDIKDFEDNIKLFAKRETEAENKLRDLRKHSELLKKEEYNIDIRKLKINALNEKKESKEKVLKQVSIFKNDIGNINNNKIKLLEELETFKNLEKDYENIKKELDELKDKELGLEIEKAKLEKDISNYNEICLELNKEIDKKLKLKDKLKYISSLQYWLEDDFIKLIEIIEKNIMIKVHNDFSDLFEKWFDVLVDNELIKIKLYEDFTPLIEQNGHDIDYNYLSGGEKTAAALAYRLALNQVINNMSNIKTKDLIILDEPTDGFSSEQLDRMRLILDELNIKQVIIVSHDPKIESFCDNIIRLNKKEHVTEII